MRNPFEPKTIRFRATFQLLHRLLYHASSPPTLIKVPPIKVLRASILVRVILVSALIIHIMLIVHLLSLTLRMALSLLAVEPVLAFCLSLCSCQPQIPVSHCCIMVSLQACRLRHQQSPQVALWQIGAIPAFLTETLDMCLVDGATRLTLGALAVFEHLEARKGGAAC